MSSHEYISLSPIVESILHPTCLNLLLPYDMQHFHFTPYKRTISNVKKHSTLLMLLKFLGKLTLS